MVDPRAKRRSSSWLAIAVAGVVALGLVAGGRRPDVDGGRLALTSFGPIPAEDLALLRDDLTDCFHVVVRTLEPLPLPESAYLPERRQYDAKRLLEGLQRVRLDPGERLLALCDADGCRLDMSFVLGLARTEGGRGLVFLPRLREHATDEVYRRRLTTTARHEVGHLYGLGHCTAERCAMRFSSTVADTDAKGPELCRRCRRRLDRVGGR